MVRAGLSALLLAVASTTACESEDVPIGEPTPDAASDVRVTSDAAGDAPRSDASTSADAGMQKDAAGDVSADAANVLDATQAEASVDARLDAALGDARDATAPRDDGSVVGEASATDAGNEANANTDGSSADATADGSSPDGGETWEGRVLVATTNFTNHVTEVATLDLTYRVALSSGGFLDTDAVPRTSEGRSFVLERTNDVLKLLDSEGVTTATIALGQDGGPSQNPHDVVVIPGTSTAYVPLYNSGRIAVVDLDAAAVTSTIDLSSFADASDSDHSPDIDGALYVPSTGLVYFTLQRIDTNSGFPIACPVVPSLVVAVDPRTRQVVAPDPGHSVIELALVSPSSMAYDAQGARLLVLSNGCAPTADGGTTRAHHGIEAISLATGQTQVLYAPTSPNFLSNLILLGPGSALVNSFDDNSHELWNRWDPTSPALGAALANVPGSAVAETADTLLGVRQATDADGGPAGYDVVRYRISTGATTVAAADPFASPYDFVGGVALVR
jgi:hypothetical protein